MAGRVKVKRQLRLKTLHGLAAGSNNGVKKLLFFFPFSFQHNSLPTTAQRATLMPRGFSSHDAAGQEWEREAFCSANRRILHNSHTGLDLSQRAASGAT